MDIAQVTLLLVLATLFVAAVTFFVAIGGIWSAAELQRSRKLEWAPFLTFQANPGDEAHGTYIHYFADIKNIGRGPAFNCLLVRRASAEVWQLSAPFDLGGGDVRGRCEAHQQESPMPKFLADGGVGRTVLLCSDQFGAYHMFDRPRPPSTSRSWFVWAEWAKWYQAQLKPASKPLAPDQK